MLFVTALERQLGGKPMVPHTHKPSTSELEAGGWRIA